MHEKEIKEHNIYEFQSLADQRSVKVKVTQMIVKKWRITKVEISRDLINCLNPFWVDPFELK